jgi:hypothetical protein
MASYQLLVGGPASLVLEGGETTKRTPTEAKMNKNGEVGGSASAGSNPPYEERNMEMDGS